MSIIESIKQNLGISVDLILEYVFQVVALVKAWSGYLGLTKEQNYDDSFYQLLHDKQYDEALKLAHRYKYLDIDLVYKCKWRHSGITVQSINSVLGKIQDKLWAINECVQTVPMSYEACRCLLEFGLQEANLRLIYELGNETNVNYPDGGKHGVKLIGRNRTRSLKAKQKGPLIDEDASDETIIGLIDFENLNDQQKELCRCRQNLLRYKHALLCYENILGDYRTIPQTFDHVFYDKFRRKCPLEICIEFANVGDAKAVDTCLLFYPEELKPHLLIILSNFPETLSPYQYRNLLPCLRGNETIFEWKCAPNQQLMILPNDWSRCDATSSLECLLKDKSETFTNELYKSNETMKKFSKPLTSDLLSEWFISRALEMESKTLLLSNAIQLLHLGSELNIKNLEKTHDDLVEFDRIVYDCCTERDIYLSFSDFNKLSGIERLILMTGDSQKNCKDRFRFYVIPYINRREQMDDLKFTAKIHLLGEYFKHLANTREQICKLIYDDLLDRIECDNFIAEWTKGMDDAIDDIGEDIRRIERDRQVKQISSMASQQFALGDFNECYEACQLIMKKNFHECWALCCQLGMHKQFNNNEAKYRLLAFALTYCDDPEGRISAKILDYIIKLRKRDEKLQMAYLHGNM